MGRHREGRQVGKTSVDWQSPRAQEAAQGNGRETDKPETETKKQPQREGRDQKGERPAAAFPGGPTRQPPAVGMGRGSQARATRTAPCKEEATSEGAGAGSAKRQARLPWPQRQRERLRRGWGRGP